MMEERYHETTQNRFYPDMSNVNKNITVEAKLISLPTYKRNVKNGLSFIHLLVPPTDNLEGIEFKNFADIVAPNTVGIV